MIFGDCTYYKILHKMKTVAQDYQFESQTIQ